ncbi:putative RNA pseudouridylate synthase family protein [Neospora caninum Liverpool]|uniref:Putative RNA pseudouridylate synthase family protein n=1 Tax=Neospora caninum (strain Liverpool) TaxID=572307 RepID=F0VN72_NEOCL|nr:putative RNA pseudouridylate synthase family protein [Neospora caninum Liverpool]CBZ55168.1 putative RNA pseudouridylate synthase family protein [Neospora caninum Liverpool]|eukprot:XP_003885196.1 putative RNA pseudouridylate synthase family protein [Neospora caninum Liverpool]
MHVSLAVPRLRTLAERARALAPAQNHFLQSLAETPRTSKFARDAFLRLTHFAESAQPTFCLLDPEMVSASPDNRKQGERGNGSTQALSWPFLVLDSLPHHCLAQAYQPVCRHATSLLRDALTHASLTAPTGDTRASLDRRSESGRSAVAAASTFRLRAPPLPASSMASAGERDASPDTRFVIDSEPADSAQASAFRRFLRGCFATALVEARRDRQDGATRETCQTDPLCRRPLASSSKSSCSSSADPTSSCSRCSASSSASSSACSSAFLVSSRASASLRADSASSPCTVASEPSPSGELSPVNGVRRAAFEESATRALAEIVLDAPCFSRLHAKLQGLARCRRRPVPPVASGDTTAAGSRDENGGACAGSSDRAPAFPRLPSDAPISDETSKAKCRFRHREESYAAPKQSVQCTSQESASAAGSRARQSGGRERCGQGNRAAGSEGKEESRRRAAAAADDVETTGGEATALEGEEEATHGMQEDGQLEEERNDALRKPARNDTDQNQKEENASKAHKESTGEGVGNEGRSYRLELHRESVVQRVRQLATLIVDLGSTYDVLHRKSLEAAADEERGGQEATEDAKAKAHEEPVAMAGHRDEADRDRTDQEDASRSTHAARHRGQDAPEAAAMPACSEFGNDQPPRESSKLAETQETFAATYEEGKMSLGDAASLIVEQPWYLLREFPIVYEDANLVIISKPFDVRVDVPLKREDGDGDGAAGEGQTEPPRSDAPDRADAEATAEATTDERSKNAADGDSQVGGKGNQLPGAWERRFRTEFTVADWYRRHSERMRQRQAHAEAEPTDQDKEPCKVRLCHQLDYATSGLLMVAHNQKTARIVQTLLQRREIQKEYLALVYGHPQWSEVEVVTLVAPHSTHAFKMMREHMLDATDAQGVPLSPVSPGAFASGVAAYRCMYGSVMPAHASSPGSSRSPSSSALPHASSFPSCASLRPPSVSSSPANSLAAPCTLASESPACFGGRRVETRRRGRSLQLDETFEEAATFKVEQDNEAGAAAGRTCQLGRRPVSKARSGKRAVSRVQVLYKGYLRNLPEPLVGVPGALVKLSLLTGRRHQLRVHCEHLGHPIVGDATYGTGDQTPFRMFLHATSLQFPSFPASSVSSPSGSSSLRSSCQQIKCRLPDHAGSLASTTGAPRPVSSFSDVDGRPEQGAKRCGGRAKTEEILFLETLKRSTFVDDPGFQFFLGASESGHSLDGV